MLTSSKKSGASLGGKRAKKYAKERAVRRVPFVASIEVTETGTGTKLAARTSEIGVGGCYIDALNPFATGAEISLRIVRDQGTFEARARVVYSDSSFGMGVAFTDLPSDQRLTLENWVAEIVVQMHPTSA